MIELEFKIDCLDGKYCFLCKCERSLQYCVETDINGLNCLEAEADEKMTNEFISHLNEAQIEKWDAEYSGENLIEDGIEWSVRYLKEDKEYLSKGKESFEPYNFESLLKAIKVCDKQLEYFGW